MTESPARTRILIFTILLGSGGAEMQALRVANNLDRRRFDVELVVMRGGGSYESALAEDVTLHALGGGRFPMQLRSLRLLIRRSRPNVVCSFLEVPNLMAAWACRGMKVRPHLVACVQAPPSIAWQGGGWRRIFRALVSRYYSRAEQVVAISHGVADDVEQLAPGAAAHTTTIYNAGVDDRVESLARLPPESGETRPRGPLIVGCGRLTEQKGFDDLINAFALLREQVPNAALWILGEGPDRPALEQQITRLSLENHVQLLGFRDNPYAYMAAADVFALSSVFEGFGNVVAEAMACGTPVVSTDCPYGPSEIITDGVNGLLVRPRDPAALANAILRVLRDPKLGASMIKQGRRRARDFAASAIAAQYGRLFDRLTSST